MGRKCSHCGIIGHNSRTCHNTTTPPPPTPAPSNGGGVMFRLFGVQFHHVSNILQSSSSSSCSISIIKKSLSLDCLQSSSTSPSLSSSPSSSFASSLQHPTSIGYLSDGLIGPPPDRKKGVPWSEEEHRRFLMGLQKLGKGDWRGISRHFVATRTPTQVASHAQKYFLRQAACIGNKRRRSSLFDMVGSGDNGGAGSKHGLHIDLNAAASNGELLKEYEKAASINWSPGSYDQSSSSSMASSQSPISKKKSHHRHRRHHHHDQLDLTLSSSSASASAPARIGGPITVT